MSLNDVFDKCENNVELHDQNSFGLDWRLPGIGFGQLYFSERDGIVYCDNENMSKERIKQILCKMVDDCELKG